MTLRFGTDGVRGLANVELTAELALALGRAAARVLGADRPFVLARDTRRSGPMLEAALAAGLAAEGADVVLAGVLPTPGAAYLSHVRGCPAAVLSASHNPYPDNGIKFFAPGGRKLTDEIEERLEAELDAVLAGGPPPTRVEGAAVGTAQPDEGARREYESWMLTTLEGRRLDGLRVVIDCGNGAATATAPWVLTQLGAKVENLAVGAQPDGTNINAGCGSTDTGPLQAEVVATGAVAGLAFDGDADRLVAVDERGGLVDGDHILAIAALDLRSRGLLRHDTVVATVMANLGFHQAMAAEGIRVETTPVGDRSVLEAMEAGGFSLGGEQSGHIIFGDLATTGDGLLSGLGLLDVLARSGRPLSELAAVVVKLPQVLRNVRVADRGAGLPDATAFWAEVAAVEAELGDAGRVLVRPSGTEPLVRIMVEAVTAEMAKGFTDRLEGALTAALGEP
ncbi:MAG TPA: phosphoglucosamine mutase [Acidimicrobiia bacterium]|jgi:phosphoglucosamine mutase|nr:phosphoglucosamine mutase [Acidimicrobiia bacterium]